MNEIPDGSNIPLALGEWETLARRIRGKRVAVFLDYDGTLTPIVDDPDEARLSEPMRRAVEGLTRHCFVAIVSGRDLADVEQRVGLEKLHYAGSHGFDIKGPGGLRLEQPEGQRAIPLLNQAQQRLGQELSGVAGVHLERKRFSLAVHYRHVARSEVEKVRSTIGNVVAQMPGLVAGRGKEVLDLRPDVDWGKGRAVLWIMEQLAMSMERWLPVFIGDDVTDEEAFATLGDRGLSFLVSHEPRATAAQWRLNDTDEVMQLLQRLADLLEDDTAP